MLVEIRGEHSGSITMFSTAAVQLFKLMGLSGSTEGAIKADQVAQSLDTLKAALEKHVEPAAADNPDNDDPPPVSLKTRAVPLIELLEKNAASGGYVMWQQK